MGFDGAGYSGPLWAERYCLRRTPNSPVLPPAHRKLAETVAFAGPTVSRCDRGGKRCDQKFVAYALDLAGKERWTMYPPRIINNMHGSAELVGTEWAPAVFPTPWLTCSGASVHERSIHWGVRPRSTTS